MKYLFFVLLSIGLHAQNLVSGNTITEQGNILQGVKVVNINNGAQAVSGNQGFFTIRASIGDELRFVKDRYDRTSRRVMDQDFLKSVSVPLLQSPAEIEEVDLGLNMTGNLKKDFAFRNSSKKSLLNQDIKDYIKAYPEEKKDMKTNAPNFGVPDMNRGQVSILSVGTGGSGGVLGLVAKQIFKRDRHKPDYTEIQNFHRKIKESFYGDYFMQHGLDEFEFDVYLTYLDTKYKFSEKYFNNFNTLEIEKKIKNLLQDYLNNK